MILEAIVTTADASGAVNIAPMGPELDDESYRCITLKPFTTSTTYANLRASGAAVVHVTDDVELFARTAVERLDSDAVMDLVELLPGGRFKLVDCCRWFAVEVDAWDDDPQRPRARCRVVHRGDQRPHFGFNRGKFAVIEAAILATRLNLLGREEILRRFADLKPLVEKTGGAAEHLAWQRLEAFVNG